MGCSIYKPAEDSYLLNKYVKEKVFGRVLDLGTGSGIQALSIIKRKEVKDILAVDVNLKAVEKLKDKLNEEKISKIKVKESDIFSNIDGKFETIIFNAPYLPQDYAAGKKIIDLALYGGKHGWEVLEKFLSKLGNHLSEQGIALVLFSSLTNKDKIDQFVEQNMLEAKLLEEQKLPMFETLYVYEVKNSKVRNALVSRQVKKIEFLASGNRGIVFKAKWNSQFFVKSHFAKSELVDVAIKITKSRSKAIARIKNEGYWLKQLNKINIGPKTYFYNEDYLVMQFIDGVTLPDFIEKNKEDLMLVKEIFVKVLEQCYELDKMKVNKEEFSRPIKHVIITSSNEVVFLDFERCHKTEKPQNVTQFCSFLMRQGFLGQETGVALMQKYKPGYAKEEFEKIIKELNV